MVSWLFGRLNGWLVDWVAGRPGRFAGLDVGGRLIHGPMGWALLDIVDCWSIPPEKLFNVHQRFDFTLNGQAN